jgi:hypothetical protein
MQHQGQNTLRNRTFVGRLVEITKGRRASVKFTGVGRGAVYTV